MCDSSVLLCLKKRFHLGRIYVKAGPGPLGIPLFSGTEPLGMLLAPQDHLPSAQVLLPHLPSGVTSSGALGDLMGPPHCIITLVLAFDVVYILLLLFVPWSDTSLCLPPQTFGGPLLLALNPHQPLALFSPEVLASYRPGKAPNKAP